MKTGFKDPIAPREEKGAKQEYDERSSCFVNVGTHYGVGYRQPVGTTKATMNSPIPKGRVDTMRIYEKG